MKLTFLGAAETVTGSMYLLDSGKTKVIIDCGMFQGLKQLRLKNWESFNFDIDSIDGVLLTHAHVDHSGRLPLLVKQGYKKKIFATPATMSLAEILLKDSAMLQMEDAKNANEQKYSKHHPAKPLYDFEDVQETIKLFSSVNFKESFNIGDLEIHFHRAGHILGASQVHIKSASKSILFSGDLGRLNDPLIFSPENPIESDIIVMESTYGSHVHSSEDPIEKLAILVKEIIKSQSVMMIPSFAVARAQLVIYSLFKLFEKYPELKIPVYLNSPMASQVSKLYLKYLKEHQLSLDETIEVFSLPKYIDFVKESVKLNEKSGPMIVIAGSGMITGGRILHHLWSWGKDPSNMILLVGYQAEGTRGYDLARDQRILKMHGGTIEIQNKIEKMEMFSAHADQKELLSWLSHVKNPKKVMLVHGEKDSLETLKNKIQSDCKFPVEIALPDQVMQW